jgi:hypothetical protein
VTPEMEKIIAESIPIPGSEYRFHPAVPVRLFERNKDAQRKSPLPRLKKKGGKFDVSRAGIPRVVPNGTKFYPVIGATRCEWAREANGPDSTLPVEVFPEEMSNAQQAAAFLDELVSNPPGTKTQHTIGVVTGRQKYLDVAEAEKRLKGNLSIGALTIIRKSGADLLRATVDEALRCFPNEAAKIPSAVLRGIAITIDDGTAIAERWRRSRVPASALLSRARIRQSQHGGHGTVYSHVAALLCGGRKKKSGRS